MNADYVAGASCHAARRRHVYAPRYAVYAAAEARSYASGSAPREPPANPPPPLLLFFSSAARSIRTVHTVRRLQHVF